MLIPSAETCWIRVYWRERAPFMLPVARHASRITDEVCVSDGRLGVRYRVVGDWIVMNTEYLTWREFFQMICWCPQVYTSGFSRINAVEWMARYQVPVFYKLNTETGTLSLIKAPNGSRHPSLENCTLAQTGVFGGDHVIVDAYMDTNFQCASLKTRVIYNGDAGIARTRGW